MTDQTETPASPIPAATVCDVEDCHALIPDTIEDRRAHRIGHKHREKVDQALRGILRDLRTDFANLRGQVRDDVKAIRDEVDRVDRAVGQIEIPEAVVPLTITRRQWDDEDDQDDDEDAAAALGDEWDLTVNDPAPATDLGHLPDQDDDEDDDYAEPATVKQSVTDNVRRF